MLTGQVSSDPASGPVYVFEVVGAEALQVQKLPAGGGFYAFVVPPEKRLRLIAFADANANQQYDTGEQWNEVTQTLILAPREQRSVPVLQLAAAAQEAPAHLLRAAAVPPQKPLPFTLGEVTSLSDPRFSEERANTGMWEPLASSVTNGSGVYFLEPHRPERTPVLFVHGIQGSPTNFAPLVAKLAPNEEAWLVQYPSGIRLPIVARVLADAVSALRAQHHVEHLRVVAHSMGGLVSRAMLLELNDRGQAGGIDEFVTVATPYGGVASAQSGLDSPLSKVPSWVDIAPESDFLKSLRRPLPSGLKLRLFAAVGQRSGFVGGNNDGTVAVSSQLPEWVVDGASQVLSFDAGHVEVLAHPSVVAQIIAPLPR
jgi:pimeloyl-ACP methyl ester carboxylesterase